MIGGGWNPTISQEEQMRAHTFRTAKLAASALLLTGCQPFADAGADPLGVEPVLSLSADRCENFEYETVGSLGVHFGTGTEAWHGRLGAQPTPVTIAGLSGMMFSWVDSYHYSGAASGNPMQGAEHLSLHHRFETASGWFQTNDSAVCSPSGVDGGCVVHDQMRIADGGGVFANAEGWIKNQGQITFGPSGTPIGGTLELGLRGRVCGDGL